MFDRIATLIVNRSVLVLVMCAAVFTTAAAVGAAVIPRMSGGGYGDSSSESARVVTILEDTFQITEPHLTLAIGQIDVKDSVDKPAVTQAANDVISDLLKTEGVAKIDSYWSLNKSSNLKSHDGSLALVFVYLEGETLDIKNAVSKQIIESTPAIQDDVEIYIGGTGAIYTAINTQITQDITFAEFISIPLTLILLLIVFGTAIAAGMPLMVGISAIGGALFGIWAVSLFTEVSVFALNLITGLGLGLGIDYALLIVNRFREELARGRDVADSIRTTLKTAGKTVMVSGLTVALTLGSMIVFPQSFLKSFAYAGVAVCMTAVLGALIPLPAALYLLGHKIDKFKIRRGNLAPGDDGAWATIARNVMKRPIVTTVSVLIVLISLATPSLTAQFSQVDDRVLPASSEASKTSQLFRDEFDSNESAPIEIIIPAGTSESAITKFASDVSLHEEIIRVETPAGIITKGQLLSLTPEMGWPGTTLEAAGMTRLRVIGDVQSRSIAAQDLITDLREMSSSPQGTLIGGVSADFTDSQRGIGNRLGWALLWVAVATLILLFLFTGSVLLPIKAIVLNVLSLGSTMGVLTWMFQNGNLQWLTGEYTVTNTLDTSTLVLITIVTFGLSMDYEVFLLSRIKEEHDAGSETTESVALGLQRSGRIISAAAALLAVVFAAFLTSSVTSIKMLGFGIAFAILLDATVVRGLLVPALMRIAGRYNWWAPAPLRKLHERFGITD
ncbi:MAG: hypothetical protein RIS75_229 [Actinomycetota bacterium]